MNLILGILWLGGAVGLFAYEYFTGVMKYRIRGLDISAAWLLLVLALYNFARWYSYRMAAKEAEAMRYVDEARLRQAQRRERSDPDPTFDFSDPPKPPPAGGEPSNN